MKRKELEENGRLCLDFGKLKKITRLGLRVLPVVVQDWQTKEVLLLAYANAKAVSLTVERRTAVFWSTSRNELWIKGETSGCVLKIKDVRVNCEQNSLLYLVEPVGGCGACHTKDRHGSYRKSCYYRKINMIKLGLSKKSRRPVKSMFFLSQCSL
ncbi:MAG: phosphoribosyl-AMP cyclohydrolase [bacterium]|nr:phosphoribosyl-AMP cyclohydrolase [bacterium]